MSTATQRPARLPTGAHAIREHARASGARKALVIPSAWSDGTVTEQESLTYDELWSRVCDYARGFDAQGLVEGDRVLVAAPLSADLYALLLGLFSRGLTAVFIDATTRSAAAVRSAIDSARPRAFVATKELLRYRFVFPRLWRARAYVTAGRALGATSLAQLRRPGDVLEPLPISPDTDGIITYTSGSTGRPKGVVRTYGVSVAQHEALRVVDELGAGDVHLTSLPVVAFHNLMSGATTVLPARNPLERHGTDARAVVAQLESEGVTHLSGAPAFIEEVADELLRHGRHIPSLRMVVTGAAPVGAKLAQKLVDAFRGAEVRVVYGSTEAEPMAFSPAFEVIAQPGRGYLVGRPTPNQQLLVVHPQPDRFDVHGGMHKHACACGEEGEVVVSGPHVVERYFNDPAAEARLKVRDAHGVLWHRTGDLGYFDARGQLWITGRAADRVQTARGVIAPLPIEARLNDLAGVRRSALISHARAPQGEVLLELADDAPEHVLAASRRVLESFGLSDLPLSVVSEIPVDPRHFSKLDRVSLRERRGEP